MELSIWIGFVLASAVLVLVPGPTVMLVVSYALGQGRRVALAAVAGVAVGDIIAIALSLGGLGAVLATSAALFTALKWIGAAYLVYLGIRLWRAPPVLATRLAEPRSHRSIFWHATLVTALNPKGIAFFVAFMPHFIDPARPALGQILILGTTFVAVASGLVLVYALAADWFRRQISRPAVLKWVNRTGAGCLIGMGATTAALSRS